MWPTFRRHVIKCNKTMIKVDILYPVNQQAGSNVWHWKNQSNMDFLSQIMTQMTQIISHICTSYDKTVLWLWWPNSEFWLQGGGDDPHQSGAMSARCVARARDPDEGAAMWRSMWLMALGRKALSGRENLFWTVALINNPHAERSPLRASLIKNRSVSPRLPRLPYDVFLSNLLKVSTFYLFTFTS